MNKYIKQYLSLLILNLIQLIEFYQYRNLNLDENDINKKIISSKEIDGILISTDTGFKPISHIHDTQPYKLWKIQTESGLFLEGADNHIIFKEGLIDTFIKDIKCNDYIHTVNGLERITSVTNYNVKISMFDVTVADENHRFYSNGILSHNTICSAIYIAWYLLFNFDKNALILANKGTTTKEIIDKAKIILQHVPFFMKPGIRKNDVYEMKFDNGCRLVGQNTTSKAGIGFTIHLLFLDEFAHVHHSFVDSFFENVYPTLSSSKISRIIITSTPNGYNKFYEIYKAAIEGASEFKAFKVDWWQVPGRDEAWKKRETSNLGSEEAFNRQYGNQFLASSNLLLQGSTIKRLQKGSIKYVHHLFEEFENIEIDTERYLGWDPNFDTMNCTDHEKYFVFSVDVADGSGGDYSVINIFELININEKYFKYITTPSSMKDFFGLKQVARFSSNEHSIEDFSKILYTLSCELFYTENLKIVLEWNYNGALVMKHLQTLFPNKNKFDDEMVCRFKHRHDARTSEYGLKIKKDNKVVFCQSFKKFIETRRLIVNDSNTIHELETFGKLSTGSYGGQLGNDDMAMTAINVTEFMTTPDFTDYVEEMLDLIDSDIHDRMESILNKVADGDSNLDFDIYDLVKPDK